jgi:hypothetical protein
MNTEELKTAFPVLIEGNSHRLHQHHTLHSELFKHTNQIADDDSEVQYLTQLELFITKSYLNEIQKIKTKTAMIERTKNFDCSKIKNLPDDMIYEIKSYLAPELNYVRKFSILRQIDSGFSWWRDVDDYIFKVPKKLIIDLKDKCNIYPSMYVKSSDQKEKWCRMIIDETQKLFSKKKDMMRVDKLLANRDAEWSSDPKVKLIDKWFKFFLYINTFKKYRAELETKVKKTDEKLALLKNKKIVVK